MENDRNFPRLDKYDGSEDFTKTLIKEIPEEALPYIIDNFGHWELVDDACLSRAKAQ